MPLVAFRFPTFAHGAGAIFLCRFAMVAGGVKMFCWVTVLMFDGQVV